MGCYPAFYNVICAVAICGTYAACIPVTCDKTLLIIIANTPLYQNHTVPCHKQLTETTILDFPDLWNLVYFGCIPLPLIIINVYTLYAPKIKVLSSLNSITCVV